MGKTRKDVAQTHQPYSEMRLILGPSDFEAWSCRLGTLLPQSRGWMRLSLNSNLPNAAETLSDRSRNVPNHKFCWRQVELYEDYT